MSASQPESRALRALGERIAREEDAFLARPLPPDQATLRTSRRPTRRRPAVWVAAAVAASFLLVGIGAIVAVRSRPLVFTVGPEGTASGGWISAPSSAPVPIRFSEGTEVELEPEAHARVAEVTRKGAHVLLESGVARVSVTPNRGGQWVFTAGPFQVDVKGTRFEIAWSPREQAFTLKLVEGSVVISGCALGDGRPLFAGETIRASCLSNEFHIDGPVAGPASASASASVLPVPSLDPDESATRPSPATLHISGRGSRNGETLPATETWQSLARASRFKDAFARVNERGFDAELSHAGKDDLLLLGDVARLSGDAGRALLAYERVRSRAAGTEAAANAAFAMGRVDFDQRASYAEAARWFGTYRSERSSGPLARDATGRQMEALSRAGDASGAARVADEYLRKYPAGPHAPLARTLRTEAN